MLGTLIVEDIAGPTRQQLNSAFSKQLTEQVGKFMESPPVQLEVPKLALLGTLFGGRGWVDMNFGCLRVQMRQWGCNSVDLGFIADDGMSACEMGRLRVRWAAWGC